jgi:hypothetical protein
VAGSRVQEDMLVHLMGTGDHVCEAGLNDRQNTVVEGGE